MKGKKKKKNIKSSQKQSKSLKFGPRCVPYLSLIIYRPGVAGAVLKTPVSLVYLFSQSVSFSSKSLKSQTITTRELKF